MFHYRPTASNLPDVCLITPRFPWYPLRHAPSTVPRYPQPYASPVVPYYRPGLIAPRPISEQAQRVVIRRFWEVDTPVQHHEEDNNDNSPLRPVLDQRKVIDEIVFLVESILGTFTLMQEYVGDMPDEIDERVVKIGHQLKDLQEQLNNFKIEAKGKIHQREDRVTPTTHSRNEIWDEYEGFGSEDIGSQDAVGLYQATVEDEEEDEERWCSQFCGNALA